MKVACFASIFPSKFEDIEVYGAGRVAYNLCRKLAEKGHSIQVFVPFSRDLVENHGNLIVHFYRSIFTIGIMNISWRLFFDPLNYSIDIVHIHNDTPISMIAGLRCAREKGKPLVVTWHGDWIESYGGVIRRIGVYLSNKYLVNKVLSKARAIITPSKYYVEESRFLKRYRTKLIEIPNGINLEIFNIPYSKDECRKMLGLVDAKEIILYLSALYPLKGPQVLLKAVPEIVRAHKDTFLVFVGGGEVDKYKTLSKELGVQNYVKFTGYVEERLKPLYYKASDIFVLPSIKSFEVFPLVLLEASASGLPMVVSDLNTFKCIIEDGYNGVVTKKDDPKAFTDAIVYLLENKDVRKKMGENARKRVENYSWEKIAEMTEKVYEQVINKL
jgi:glycosyltransferase involved in cell wall biosynthesis